jgi:hypothetical protein
MNYKELKKHFRYEYRIVSGEYLILDISETNRTDDHYIFEIQFQLNFKTYMFCPYTIKKGVPNFKINKIITINHFGYVYEFSDIDGFIEFIDKLENVEEIHKYGR